MRYKEFIIEKQEPIDWEKINLRTIQSWIELQSVGTKMRVPKLDNALLLVGMVGDPKFRDQTGLTYAHEMTQLVLGNKDGHKLMNKYAPGEKITLDTLIRATKEHDLSGTGTLGGFRKPQHYQKDGGGPIAGGWKIRIGNKDGISVHQFRKMVKTVEKNVTKITYEIDDRVLQIRDTFFHECMHRGIAYWRLLVAKGQIEPSKKTKWVILQSNYGRKGWGADGDESTSVHGEHAVIYNRLLKQSSFMDNYPRNWHFANKDKLKSDFGIKSQPRLGDYETSDGKKIKILRYAPIGKDANGDRYDKWLSNDATYNKEIKNFLDSVYETLSDEIAQFLGVKINRFNWTGQDNNPNTDGGQARDNISGPDNNPTSGDTGVAGVAGVAVGTSKKRNKNKEVAVEILTGLLTTLKDPQLRVSIAGYTPEGFAAHVSRKANITTARANEILLDTVEKIFTKYKTITPTQVKTAVTIIFLQNK